MKSISEIADLIESYSSAERPFIVGIDGLGGSGKTTLANKLYQELTKKKMTVVVIHLDNHIVEQTKRYQTGHPEWYEYYYLQWDIEMLQKKLFHKLHNKEEEVTLPFYNKSTNFFSKETITLNRKSIIIIEGVFLQRKEWRDYLNFVLYIDCPRTVRMKRVLNRDRYLGNYDERLHKYQRRYWLGEEHYVRTENPKRKADIIVNKID